MRQVFGGTSSVGDRGIEGGGGALNKSILITASTTEYILPFNSFCTMTMRQSASGREQTQLEQARSEAVDQLTMQYSD